MFLVEGNIDFYAELNKDDDELDDKVCLITNKPLLDDHIILECNHSFNYEPLLNDITNHKNKFNKLEKYILSAYEIRCPYCRNIQNKLLPLNPLYPKIHGVNYFDEEICLSIITTNSYDYKWKKGVCMYSPEYIYSNQNELNCSTCTNNNVSFIDLFNITLCYQHKNEYLNNYIIKQKQIKKDKEMKIKEEKKLAKLNYKLSLPNCSKINKNGKQCSFKCTKDGLCSRHYNLLNKSKEEEIKCEMLF